MAAQVGITDKAFIIAALDFGSTFSAYAYTFKSEYERDRSKLYSSRWEGTQQPTVKAPTIVLFEENGTFNSFGYEAESRYAELAERGSHVGWRYFRYFKMSLYEKREIGVCK